MRIKMPKNGKLSGKPNVKAGWPGRTPNKNYKDGWVGSGSPSPKASKAGWPNYTVSEKAKSSPQSKRRQPKSRGQGVAQEKALAIRTRVAGGNALDVASKAMRRRMKQPLNKLVE